MGSSAPNYYLFPQTTLSEEDCKRLSIFLPAISLLQIVRPPAVPEWAREIFPGRPALRTEEETAQVSLYLRSCREFADLHGENGIMAYMSRDWTGESQETRIRIQNELKGTHLLALDRQQGLVLEAAAFLEMARDLDEREMEIDSGLLESSGLEDRFRKILGIEEGDEAAENMEPLNPPLAPDKSGLPFMTLQRAALWLRLYSIRRSADFPVLVALNGELAEEILDPVKTVPVPTGENPRIRQIRLATIPDPGGMSLEAFQELLSAWTREGAAQSFHADLEAVLADPDDGSLLEELRKSAGSLGPLFERFGSTSPPDAPREIGLSLIRIDGFTVVDLRKALDRTGRDFADQTEHVPAVPFMMLFLN